MSSLCRLNFAKDESSHSAGQIYIDWLSYPYDRLNVYDNRDGPRLYFLSGGVIDMVYIAFEAHTLVGRRSKLSTLIRIQVHKCLGNLEVARFKYI